MNKNLRVNAISRILEAVNEYGTDLERYKELGNIKVIRHSELPLLLFSYTVDAMFDRKWSPIERICRPLIIDYEKMEVIAVGFEKFFNLNEMPETLMENLDLTDKLVEVTSKLDGSLIICAKYNNELLFTTKGAFNSEQAEWAKDHYNRNYSSDSILDNVTYLFECIYPENRIVVDYGEEEGLYLLGLKSNLEINGYCDYSSTDMAYAVKSEGFQLVSYHNFISLELLLKEIENSKGIEGFVLRIVDRISNDTIQRIKIKSDEYRQLHKFRSTIVTPDTVREAMLTDNFEDYLKNLKSSPFHDGEKIKSLYTRINIIYHEKLKDLRNTYNFILKKLEHRKIYKDVDSREYKKQFALLVQEYFLPGEMEMQFMFMLYNGQEIEKKLLEKLDLSKISSIIDLDS